MTGFSSTQQFPKEENEASDRDHRAKAFPSEQEGQSALAGGPYLMTEGDADERNADGHSHQEEQEQQWPMLAGEAVLLIELCLVGALITLI